MGLEDQYQQQFESSRQVAEQALGEVFDIDDLIQGVEKEVDNVFCHAMAALSRGETSEYCQAENWDPAELEIARECAEIAARSLGIDHPEILVAIREMGFNYTHLLLRNHFPQFDLSRIIQPDWEQVYATFDGMITPCLRERCPETCCGQKPDEIDGGLFNSLLITSHGELDGQHSLSPPFKEMGIITRTNWSSGLPLINQPLTRVSGCRNKNGACKLETRKPFACRLYPFRFDLNRPLEENCPQVKEIASHKPTRERLREVRLLTGHWPQDDQWEAQIDKLLEAA
ncbi:hypothetical protein HN748_04125 [Candidatus Peregrinibacteria bacterium]|nr:hypothetical protein [Candidatus Peregrinibacteria bacterium]MBT7483650.1 hypothetical protein [Candidatus Peregrinibacteria bacterium]MBT7703397.1 hypothetical protein [Candidatus Peregrinibacteria bacterium]